ncbi:cupin domain-containing protein [Yinghuangia soli]|uniref:Cupin domain-containing protein n=1 Tax=Yinghuangia soli TaxID=2908204 RepID=A0AA41Q2C5_9ACTN|nr:cupin domain-containing protein [Yinghuangia soli]MCF2529655.1 cupin domain-containing protein [Yinghuangia soli]
MTSIKLPEIAAELPDSWNSHVVDRVGPAYLKVMRMDEMPGEDDIHPEPEALLVVEGRMEIAVGGVARSVGPGELCVVPADTVHRVLPGSRGTLFLVNLNAPDPV